MKHKDKFETVKYHVIEAYDFEKIVEEVYGVDDYNFVADQECRNDSDHTFNLDTTDWDSYEEDDLQDFIDNGEYSYLANVLIKDLIRKELIPKSNILITVCW